MCPRIMELKFQVLFLNLSGTHVFIYVHTSLRLEPMPVAPFKKTCPLTQMKTGKIEYHWTSVTGELLDVVECVL